MVKRCSGSLVSQESARQHFIGSQPPPLLTRPRWLLSGHTGRVERLWQRPAHTLGCVSWPEKPKVGACQGYCSPFPDLLSCCAPRLPLQAPDLFALPPTCQPQGLQCSCALFLACPPSQVFHFPQFLAQISASQWAPPVSATSTHPHRPSGPLVPFLSSRAVISV